MSKPGRIRKFKPSFENGGFWESYKDMEIQFEDFLKYVPFIDRNERTCSFRLASLIYAIGSHIDSAFKEIAKSSKFSKKYPEILKTKKGKPRRTTIVDYFPIASEYKLDSRRVMFKQLPKRVILIPFQKYLKVATQIQTPDWWDCYNNVKHHFHESFEEANLKNARDALAGAFLLNAVHTPAILRLYEFGTLKIDFLGKGIGEPAIEKVDKSTVENILNRGQKWPFLLETEVFKYDYSQ